MFKSIAVRRAQGEQTIADPRQARPAGFRGKPEIAARDCATGCRACLEACLTDAISLDPVRIDLGSCILCGDCAPVCPSAKLSFSSDVRLASTGREGLVLSALRRDLDPLQVSEALRRRFGRSLKLRSVSAGGCNACELEVNALTNVNFDIGRFGIDIVASSRHADGLVLTGAHHTQHDRGAAAVLGRDAGPQVRHRRGRMRHFRWTVGGIASDRAGLPGAFCAHPVRAGMPAASPEPGMWRPGLARHFQCKCVECPIAVRGGGVTIFRLPLST